MLITFMSHGHDLESKLYSFLKSFFGSYLGNLLLAVVNIVKQIQSSFWEMVTTCHLGSESVVSNVAESSSNEWIHLEV
jgi:hypothetical protein